MSMANEALPFVGDQWVCEEVWQTRAGFPAAVRHQISLGYRTGYVAVPKEHPLAGKNWFECDEVVDVHGGVTFCEASGDYWVIGFDAAHAGDFTRMNHAGALRTSGYIKDECESLAQQLKEYAGRKALEE